MRMTIDETFTHAQNESQWRLAKTMASTIEQLRLEIELRDQVIAQLKRELEEARGFDFNADLTYN